MWISIKTLQGKPIELRVAETDKLADIKECIRDKIEVDPENQRLIHYGKVMSDDNKRLTDYGVKDEDPLILMVTKKAEPKQTAEKVVKKERSLTQKELDRKLTLEGEIQALEQQKSKLVQDAEIAKDTMKKQKKRMEKEIEMYSAKNNALKVKATSLIKDKNKLVEALQGIRTEYKIAQDELKDLKKQQSEAKENITRLELRKKELEELTQSELSKPLEELKSEQQMIEKIETEKNKLIIEQISQINDLLAIYLCPISMEIVKDPVIAEDGHTYEKAEIEKWLKTHDRSPMTGKFIGKKITPNFKAKTTVMELQEQKAKLKAKIKKK